MDTYYSKLLEDCFAYAALPWATLYSFAASGVSVALPLPLTEDIVVNDRKFRAISKVRSDTCTFDSCTLAPLTGKPKQWRQTACVSFWFWFFGVPTAKPKKEPAVRADCVDIAAWRGRLCFCLSCKRGIVRAPPSAAV